MAKRLRYTCPDCGAAPVAHPRFLCTECKLRWQAAHPVEEMLTDMMARARAGMVARG